MAHLQIVAGSQLGAKFELTAGVMILGRNPECDIIVDSAAVSRSHARVANERGAYFVEDLNSRNGTFVNEQRMTDRRRLSHLDQIRVCDVVFQFHADDAVGGMFGTADVMIEDDTPVSHSSIMSKLDVSGSQRSALLTTSAEAKLQALVELTQNLGKSLALDQVLPLVLESLFKIYLQADRGFIVLRDRDGKLTPRWTRYRRPDQTPARISRTILNHVVETEQAVLSADAADDSRFDMSESIANFSIRSLMCAPLIDSDGIVLGALQIDTLDHRHRFSETDLDVLAAVASQAAVAIENAQLHEQALQRRAIQRDLELANRVQTGLLPRQRPSISSYEFYDYYRAANQIGGDYFDYVALPDGRLAAIVADVSGHGIAAALLMTRLSAEARFCLATVSRPAEVLNRLNGLICDDQVDDSFVTLVMAVLWPNDGVVTLVNAGHAPPIVRRPDGQLEETGGDAAGLPLGILEGQKYEEATYEIQSGESLWMYTDGIPEAMNVDGDHYGSDRLHACLSFDTATIEQMVTRIIDDLHAFTGSAAQSDDVCLMCLGRH